MPAKPKTTPPSLAALARSSGIARETLRAWQAQGIDIFNPEKLLARIEAKKGRTTGELGLLKAEKLHLECQRLRAIIEKESEMLLPTQAVMEAAKFVGIACRMMFRELAGSVVERLIGMTAPQMFEVLRAEVDSRLTRLSEMDYMPNSPMAKRLEKKIIAHEKRHRQPD